ncbi:type II toxin-antitoxin system RelE/ParE family toxin [Brevundimonas sp.]|uniref:type II toxin-antitoxin system RelE/ParE family toxin n=1 Tax=Brevundimonas sp. TaxID=1871086 RepID=UPI00356B0204
MRLIWTPPALADREDIWLHIAQDNPDAAARMDDRFSAAADRLCAFPNAGKLSATPGTREVVPHRNYRLIYTMDADTIWIVALIHVARQWPPVRMDDA